MNILSEGDRHAMDKTDPSDQPNDDQRIRVSIVIPVHNRSGELVVALTAVIREARQHGGVEVLVCDDGSTEDIHKLISTNFGNCRVLVRHLRQEHAGAATARNLGIRHAAGELIVFTDSDCEPLSGWLPALLAEFQQPAVGLVGGAIDGKQSRFLSGQCINFLMSSSLGAGGARDPRALIRMKYYPRTGNMAVRTELARRAGGFPANAYGEDLAFSRRVELLGGSIRFCPSAVVVHHEKRSWWQAFLQATYKGAARVRLAFHYGQHEWLHAFPALLCIYVGLLPATLAFHEVPRMVLLAPGMLYLSCLMLLGIQGALHLRRLVAVPAVISYAVALHIGYGLGYLAALVLMLLPGRAARIPPDQ